MAEQPTDLRAMWRAENLDEVDTEVAPLAVICGVRILDPGVIERVLHGDASVCEAKNDLAFDTAKRNTAHGRHNGPWHHHHTTTHSGNCRFRSVRM